MLLFLLETAVKATPVMMRLPKMSKWQSEGIWSFGEISAFLMLDGFLQCTVMALGMRDAPTTFQRLVTRCCWVCLVEAHLDEVYSNTWLSHMGKLKRVSERLRQANLTPNVDKCEFVRPL